MKKRFFSLLRGKKGDAYIMLIIIAFCLIAVGLLLGETLRAYGVRDQVEYEIQRAVNIAVEDAMADSWRQDKEGVLDLNAARDDFYEYLEVYLELDARLNHYGSNGEIAWQLELEPLQMTIEPPRLTARGRVYIQSTFGIFGDGTVSFEFAITSRNVRID